MEMQLVIRAPNQNIEDQVINCNGDWTILRLKTHLSEVYPSRPVILEQKLIYSGHILHDHLQLRDVVRSDDTDSNVYIFHLVYNGRYPMPQEQNSTSSQGTSNSTLFTHTNGYFYPNAETFPGSTMRHRAHAFLPQMNMPQLPVGTFSAVQNDPQTLAQMAAMQQMYAQYMAQYWQSINVAAMTGNPPVFPVMPNFQLQQDNTNNPAVVSPPQQQVNQRVFDMENPEENELANRDWLDSLFQYCRFLILLSIVYFYSTPERFMLVILCVVIAILYREGWFMRQTFEEVVLRRRNSTRPEGEANAPANNASEQAQSNENDPHDGQELEAAMDGENPPNAQNPDVINNNQGFSAFSIIAAFFFSLVPEPPPPVNIN